MVKVTYKVGDKVFAKVKGYPPWPARIEGDSGKKKYNVLFYGTQETGAIKPEDLCYYSKNKDNIIHKYLKRAGYDDAVKQIEEAIKKDGGDGNEGAGAGDDSANDVDISDASSISSASEKKTSKRKATSLPDEPVQKKALGRSRRRSAATSDSKEDQTEEPVLKKPRRKSNASTDNESKEDAGELSKNRSDSGIKDETLEEDNPDENEEKIEDVESNSVNAEKVVKNESVKEDGDESSEAITNAETGKTAKKTDSTIENEKRKSTETEEQSSVKSQKDGEKDSKEPEFIEIENNADSSLQMEGDEASEESEKTRKTNMKIEIVTEQMLNNNILYAEHVKKNVALYKEKPVENRHDSEGQVLPVKLPSGTICGIKLHKEWPLEHSNELERALYDEEVAKSLLEIMDLLSTKKKSPNETDAVIVPDIQMTLEDIKELTYGRDIESKRKRLERLKKEADLVTWDAKIKNNLGLDKALPETALEGLKEFSKMENDLDVLMFKKHPHVLDTVRRLRKYIGNIKEWNMTSHDLEIFTNKAEKIRSEAEIIYDKIKSIVKASEDKNTFWEAFMDLVSEFRVKCKDMLESEVLVLCAEPGSRQAFLDKLDEVAESEGTSINASNTSEPVLKEASVQGWTEKKET